MSLWPSEEHKIKLLALLRLHGVVKVVSNFSGGGDSGEIEPCALLDINKNEIDLKKHFFDWNTVQGVWDDTHTAWRDESKVVSLNVHDILDGIIDNLVEHTGQDWYNNDGGSGCVIVDFTTDPPSVTVEMSIYETVSHDSAHDFSDYFFDPVEE